MGKSLKDRLDDSFTLSVLVGELNSAENSHVVFSRTLLNKSTTLKYTHHKILNMYSTLLSENHKLNPKLLSKKKNTQPQIYLITVIHSTSNFYLWWFMQHTKYKLFEFLIQQASFLSKGMIETSPISVYLWGVQLEQQRDIDKRRPNCCTFDKWKKPKSLHQL